MQQSFLYNYNMYTIPVLLFSIILRCLLSQNSYSGENKPPLYGDYEAQRHWMEITYNLPTNIWYHNSTDNDLQYWGLDYPPLTAYHSNLMGYIAHKVNPEYVALFKSRGFESPSHKLFMRYTVILVDVFVFMTAIIFFFNSQKHLSEIQKLSCSAISLLYPGLILIDHCHFQYNCVSLGLLIWAIGCIEYGYSCFGAIGFSLALNYKQMELYHSLPFFFYLLGKCLAKPSKLCQITELIKISTITILTFIICWIPFINDFKGIVQIIDRLFPFSRGIYEDKVANVWCSLSIIIKFKNYFSADYLILLCSITTLFSILPSGIHLLLYPTKRNFKLALIISALSFFLFSFQVHEKSILIAAMPAFLIVNEYKLVVIWFAVISTFSMLPLFKKDGILYAFIATLSLFAAVTWLLFPIKFKPKVKFLFCFSVLLSFIIGLTSEIITPPKTLPDIFTLLISIVCCIHFLCFWIYFNYKQIFGSKKLKSS